MEIVHVMFCLSNNAVLGDKKEKGDYMKIIYDKFLADIYDYSPCFGRARTLEPNKFNDFYFDYIRNNEEKILEFGSGTGPLTIPLARKGFSVDSIDISPYMHDIIHKKLLNEKPETRKNINLIVTDALTFRNEKLYDKLVMPEGIIIALANKEQQRQLLYSCNKNLKIGGELLFDCFQPYYHIICNKTWVDYNRFKIIDDRYILKIKYINDEYTQIQKWEMEYTKIVQGKEQLITNIEVSFRYLFYSEIELLLEFNGFRTIKIDTNYADGRGFAVIAKKIRELR